MKPRLIRKSFFNSSKNLSLYLLELIFNAISCLKYDNNSNNPLTLSDSCEEDNTSLVSSKIILTHISVANLEALSKVILVLEGLSRNHHLFLSVILHTPLLA